MARPQTTDIEKKFSAKDTANTPTSSHLPAQDAAIDQERFASDMALMREQQGALTVERKVQNERVTALALQLNYNGSTEPAVLENSAKDAIRRIGMGIFELGGYLLLLKESCAHGGFTPVLERLGINPQSASRYMSVTQRFANLPTSANLEKLGFSKMAELLPLEDGQMDSLLEEGQTGELALDDVSRMSVKELRAAVRKERAESSKHKARAERQEAVNAELHEEARLIKRLKPAEALKRIHHEAADIQAELLGLIQGGLRQALTKLNDIEMGQGPHMAGMVGQIIGELTALRDEFSLPDVGGQTDWEQWAQAQDAAKAGLSAQVN